MLISEFRRLAHMMLIAAGVSVIPAALWVLANVQQVLRQTSMPRPMDALDLLAELGWVLILFTFTVTFLVAQARVSRDPASMSSLGRLVARVSALAGVLACAVVVATLAISFLTRQPNYDLRLGLSCEDHIALGVDRADTACALPWE